MSAVTTRDPAVAGTFYPARPQGLRLEVEAALAPSCPGAAPARLLLGPHAGYMYSGAIAGAAWREVVVPPLVVVLAPNHHGIGAPLALPLAGRWRTPLGALEIDGEAAAAIVAESPLFRDDWRAHARDHALEVHLPFLQVRGEQCGVQPRIVTISVGTHALEELLEAGRAVAAGLAALGRTGVRDVLLAVSSDMSHYIPADEARALDLPALALVTACDPERLHAHVLGRGLTMCGVAPAVAGLAAARELGAGAGRLVRYGHSGEVTGDPSEVVAYAAVVLPPAW